MRGLITINWSPHNPWINEESDIVNNPGEYHHTRTTSPDYDGTVVNLKKLIDPSTNIYVQMGKPIAMGEWGVSLYGNYIYTGTFDNRKYVDVIRNEYTQIAYWVSWHKGEEIDGKSAYMAIVSHNYAYELMNDPGVITLDCLNWQ